MALKHFYENETDIPTELADHYKEKDGKFELQIEGIKSIGGVLSKNKELLGKVSKTTELQAELDAIKEKLGDDDLEDVISNHVKVKSGKVENEELAAVIAERDKLKGEAKRLTKELDELKPQHEIVRNENVKLKLEDKAIAAAIKAGIDGKYIEAAYEVARRRFKLNDKGSVVVLDLDGDETDETLDKFWTETFKEEMPIFYPAPATAGSGSPLGGTKSNGAKKTSLEGVSPVEKLKTIWK